MTPDTGERVARDYDTNVFDAATSTSPSDTYYDLPVVKEPVWIWSVPAYFFAGGAAGAAAVIGAAAQTVDRDDLDGLITRCRKVTVIGTAAGSALLVHDLGRPERFMNMLRVFRPTSAMNMGSWILAGAGSTGGLAALCSGREGFLRALGDAAGLVAGGLGLPMSGYTAVLLADTSVPFWRATRRSLPPLFVASALASACAVLKTADLSEREAAIVDRLALVAAVADAIASFAVTRDADRVERVGRPLRQGIGGRLWKLSKGLAIAGFAVGVAARGKRPGRTLGALITSAGIVASRFAIFYAGRDSARDPRATFEQQRAG